MRTQKLFWSLLGALALVGYAFGGSFGQAGAFMRFGSDARSLALGGAYSVVAKNANGLLYNPASLAALERWELAITHAQLFGDSRYDFISFGYPLEKLGNIGVAIADFGATEFDGRDEFGRSTGSFGVHELSAIVGYGRWIWGRRLRVGASAKFVLNSVGDGSAAGFGGVDLGVITKDLSRSIRLGVAVQNLGALDVAGDKYPMTIRASLGYRALRQLYLLADVDLVGGAIKPHVGAEFKLRHVLLRAGYNASEITLGLGLVLDGIFHELQSYGRPVVDYCAAIGNPLGNDFARFSITLRGRERYKLSDLLVQTNPCERLTEFEGLLDKDGLVGAKANLMFADCYFNYESKEAPLAAAPKFDRIYSYLREAYIGKFGSNWTQAIMTLEGANLVFSQRTHYMFAECAMHKGITEETKKLIQDLIFVGGDSTQYDVRLQYDLGYTYEMLGYTDSAKSIYGAIASREGLEDPVKPLSLYRLALLLQNDDPDSAIKLLDALVRDFPWGFYDETGERVSYPMFPKYKDNSITDDALLLMGDIYAAKGGEDNLRAALQAYLDILLFYPTATDDVLKAACERAANVYSSLGMSEEAELMRQRAESL